MTRDFFAQLQAMIAEHWPGTAALEVRIKLTTGQKVTLPVPMIAPAATVPPAAAKQKFIPTAVQRAILDALDGEAMRTRELEEVQGLRGHMFKKPGGMDELKEQGLVKNHPRLGFYRPDAPPPELEEESGTEEDK